MAKATKRKVNRARGNNLKKTVRRGRKLNRAVNHVKATKKRRKSRSRRTSRKVRNSLNLNQSGGKAGTAEQAIALFNRILGPENSYSTISQLPNVISREGVDEKGKHFIILYNTKKSTAVKFRHYSGCFRGNEALKFYYYNSPAVDSISGYPVVLSKPGEEGPEIKIVNLSENTTVTQTPDGSTTSKDVLLEALKHIGLGDDPKEAGEVTQVEGAPEVAPRQLFIIPNEIGGGNQVFGNQPSESFYEMPIEHKSESEAIDARTPGGDLCPLQQNNYVYSVDVSNQGSDAAAAAQADEQSGISTKTKRLVELSIAQAAAEGGAGQDSKTIYMNVTTDTNKIIHKNGDRYFEVPIDTKQTEQQTITFTKNTLDGPETTTDVTYSVVSRA